MKPAADEEPDPWEQHALWWRDNFTEGADAEYEELILPLLLSHLEPGTNVLDLGCGEGQVSRMAAVERGCAVLGVDPAAAQLAEAAKRGGSPWYCRARATSIPLRQGCVDAVVASLVFEHVEDLPGALCEVARVLRPGGRFLMLLNHPLVQTPGSGWVDDHMVDPPEQYWQLGPYLLEVANQEQVGPGVNITFHHRPLSRYLNAAAERGLWLQRMEEPPPPEGFVARAPEYEYQRTIPRMLFLLFGRDDRAWESESPRR